MKYRYKFTAKHSCGHIENIDRDFTCAHQPTVEGWFKKELCPSCSKDRLLKAKAIKDEAIVKAKAIMEAKGFGGCVYMSNDEGTRVEVILNVNV